MPHSLTDLVIHVIFSTKGRRQLLDDSLKPRLFSYIRAILRERGARLHSINGPEDHVHMLLSIPGTVALADLMRFVKGGSSHWIRREFPDRQDFGWQEGYAAFSVSHSRLPHVHEHIARQLEHHAKVTFREELHAFLNKHEIAYDERYLRG